MMYEPMSNARTNEVPGLEDYIKAVRNRKWIVLAITVLGLVLATLWANSRTESYDATARVLVRPTPVGSVDNQEAAPVLEREKEQLQSNAVAREVQTSLGLATEPTALLAGLSVRFEPNSDTLRLTYTDQDPAIAQEVVNAFASVYVNQREQAAIDFYNNQITVYAAESDQITQQQAANQAQIDALLQERAGVAELPNTDPTKQPRLTQIDNEVASLRNTNSQLNQRQTQIATAVADIQRRVETRTPAAEVLGEAQRPSTPNGFTTRQIQVAGLVLGLLFGVVTAFVLDRLDKTARDSGDVELALGSPVLSTVPQFGIGNRSGSASLVMLGDKKSASAQRSREAYRRLRSSVQFLATSSGTKSFVITSATAGEGKSTTAANLALAFAQSGARTVLVSADLRRPTIPRLFGISNAAGLSQWLAGDENVELELMLSNVRNLSIVPSGPTPANPGELLASPRFEALLRHFEQSYDVVLIDTPPVEGAADAAAVAPMTGGVIAVVDGRRTDTNALLQIRSDVSRSGGKVVGAVLNRDKSKNGGLLRGRYGYYERAAANA
jgi:capsular exopolysaccharide synthesis family protein